LNVLLKISGNLLHIIFHHESLNVMESAVRMKESNENH